MNALTPNIDCGVKMSISRLFELQIWKLNMWTLSWRNSTMAIIKSLNIFDTAKQIAPLGKKPFSLSQCVRLNVSLHFTLLFFYLFSRCTFSSTLATPHVPVTSLPSDRLAILTVPSPFYFLSCPLSRVSGYVQWRGLAAKIGLVGALTTPKITVVSWLIEPMGQARSFYQSFHAWCFPLVDIDHFSQSASLTLCFLFLFF